MLEDVVHEHIGNAPAVIIGTVPITFSSGISLLDVDNNEIEKGENVLSQSPRLNTEETEQPWRKGKWFPRLRLMGVLVLGIAGGVGIHYVQKWWRRRKEMQVKGTIPKTVHESNQS